MFKLTFTDRKEFIAGVNSIFDYDVRRDSVGDMVIEYSKQTVEFSDNYHFLRAKELLNRLEISYE